MLGIVQIAKGSPCHHGVYDPDRQETQEKVNVTFAFCLWKLKP